MSSDRELCVLHFMPDLAMGGGQQVLLRHVPFWVAAGTTHIVAYFEPEHSLRAACDAAGAHPLYVPHRGARDWPRTLRALSRLVAERGVDILHTNGTLVDKLNGHSVAIATKRPMVTTLHGVRPPKKPMPRRPRAFVRHARERTSRRVERFLEPRTVNQYVAVSDAVRANWRGYLNELQVPDASVRVIYSGIPVEQFAEPDAEMVERLRADLRVRNGPILIAAGRFHRGKNLDVLPRVLEQVRRTHPDAQLLLAGSGHEEGALRSQVTKMGLSGSVRFLGTRNDLAELFALSDALLFPSGSEGFGLVVVEALASGLPVVTTRLPSLERLWSRDLGIELADSITPTSFAAATERVLRQPERARAKASFGQTVIRDEWSSSVSAAKYLEVYREIAGRAPGFRR